MRFLLDEMYSERAVEILCERGHDAVHVRAIGLGGAPDADVLARAVDERRTLVTENARDFLPLLDQRQSAGVSTTPVLVALTAGRGVGGSASCPPCGRHRQLGRGERRPVHPRPLAALTEQIFADVASCAGPRNDGLPSALSPAPAAGSHRDGCADRSVRGDAELARFGLVQCRDGLLLQL